MPLNNKQLAILRAIADGKESQEKISVTLNWDKDVVGYSLDEMEKSEFIKGAKFMNGSGDLEYHVCLLTRKGRVALSNPEDLIQNESSSTIYNQSGNFGIGHMSGGTIQSGANVAGVMNGIEKKNLAEAAAEIQQLIDQLSQTYSPAEAEQKVAENLANKAKQDPSFKQSLKSWSQSLLGKGSETAVVETVKEGVKRVIPLAISLLI